jgi:hypothetical protein
MTSDKGRRLQVSKSSERSAKRMIDTQANVGTQAVVRFCGIVTEPTEFRHTLHSAAIPPVAFWGIKQRGLRVSREGVSAQYGDGAYVWRAKADMGTRPFVDVVVPPGTMIEELHVNGQDPFYRLLPQSGDHIRVEVVGHKNLPDDETLEQYRSFAK